MAKVLDPAPPVVVDPPGRKYRHTPLDLNRALHKCYEFATKIEPGPRMSKRDEKRVREAFDMVAQKKKDNPYWAFLVEAERDGGDELDLLLALALGKATYRDMKEVK